jgi:hypothetical protein
VFDRLSKILIGIVAIGVLSAGAWAQAPAAPQWKDQGEFDLAQSINKETDPQKKLDLVGQWEQKYPDSALKGQRMLMKMQIESGIAPKALMANAPAADLAAAQKAAQDLVDNLDNYFADTNKPAQLTADQWQGAKQQVALLSHTVLATVAMAKKDAADDATAEAEFKKALEVNPNSAQTSYQLGMLILREKNVARMPDALFEIARAIGDTGPLALAPQAKQQVDAYLKKAYEGYHGDATGLEDLKKAAMAGALPPAGFHIESVTEIQQKQEGDAAAFAAAHPDLALWRQIRDALKGDGGDKYFEDLKGAQVPPEGQAGFTMFPAKVISQPSPKELLVSVDGAAGDATLQFDAPLNGMVDAGTALKFKGVVDSFTKEPYMLTFTGMAKEDIEGLPDSLFKAAPPKRRPAPKKKAAQ